MYSKDNFTTAFIDGVEIHTYLYYALFLIFLLLLLFLVF